jgi:hypothetical protein
MHADLEYEVQLAELKAQFMACQQWELFCRQQGDAGPHAERLRMLREGCRRRLALLRRHVREHFARFDARAVSSLLGMPSRPLAGAELAMHRIWLGGPPSAAMRTAICQWEAALDAVGDGGDPDWSLVLWVWDGAQLAADPRFRAQAEDDGDPLLLGRYVAGRNSLRVRGLRALACRHGALPPGLADALHAARRYVNLSDYFRLLVLREYGGVYVDADTMPYRAATVFLARPEVPDYVRFTWADGQVGASAVSWLNLVDDENGLLVARRGDAAVRALVADTEAALARLPAAPGAAPLQQATWGLWRREIGSTLLAWHDVEREHGVLHEGRHEPVLAGLAGMRLRHGDDGRPMPLSAHEERCYRHTTAALAARGWRLDTPRELERHAELEWISELPRMAYAPQLRARDAACNYYSFLSDDPQLDRVNTLFAGYLLDVNGERIRRGGFWQATRGTAAGVGAPPAQARREVAAQ